MKTNFEKALKKFDELISDYYSEDATVEDNEEKRKNWTIRDLVAEMDYCLSRYYEEGNCCCDDRFDDYQEWAKSVARMKRFIRHWLPWCEGVKCYEGHCSTYDNPENNEYEDYRLRSDEPGFRVNIKTRHLKPIYVEDPLESITPNVDL